MIATTSAPDRAGRAGDALETLLVHYQDVHGVVSRQAGCAEVAADVMQEAFLKLLRAPPEPTTIRRPAAFLQRMASRLLIDRVRAECSRAAGRREDLGCDLVSPEPCPQHRLEQRERLQQVQRVLDGLPPRCRQVFLRHRMRGQNYRQIAEALQIAPSTVEKHMIKALLALRRGLGAGAGPAGGPCSGR